MWQQLTGLSLLLFSAVASADSHCREAQTTVAMNQCLQKQLQQTETTLERYLEAAQQRYQDNPEVVTAINKAQAAWQQYRDDHCHSIYTIWLDGSIRGPLTWRCLIDETQARTHQLWSSYLTFMDSQTPTLPEPDHKP